MKGEGNWANMGRGLHSPIGIDMIAVKNEKNASVTKISLFRQNFLPLICSDPALYIATGLAPKICSVFIIKWNKESLVFT